MRTAVLCCGILLALCHHVFADDEKKSDKKKDPPKVCLAIPFNIVPGVTNKLKVRGLNLTNATEVRFTGWDDVTVTIKSRGKVEVPKEQDAKKWGDNQLEVEFKAPSTLLPGTNTFIVVGPDGESSPALVEVVSAESLLLEKEPNGSFKQAQAMGFKKIVQGAVGEAKDVDVFKFEGKEGTEIIAEIKAARYGSLLDAVLTLYDERGHILATNDDTDAGTDALLTARLPTDRTYYLSVMDANDRGGQVCGYNLLLKRNK